MKMSSLMAALVTVTLGVAAEVAADPLLDDERVTASDVQIERGDNTRFSGLVRMAKHRKMYLDAVR